MKKKTISLSIFMAVAIFSSTLMAQNSDLMTDNDKNEAVEHGENPGFYKQWFEKHKNADGIIPDGMPLKWYNYDLAKFALSQPESESAIIGVEQLSPTVPQGGRTRALMIDQTNENVYLAGSVSGGLWRSDNAGTTWRALNDAASSLSVTAICQNPRKPNILYYGTGETRGSSQNVSGAGIFKSTDGGLTFSVLPSTIGTTTVGTDMRFCNYIAHSLSNDSTLFVGTTNGLYRSVDGGSNWEKVLVGSNSGIICFPDGRVLASVQAGGIYISPTGSNGSFTKIVEPTFPTSGTGRILIANCKTFPSVVYALFTYASGSASGFWQEGNNGVFKSSDFGMTWEKRADSLSSIINARIGSTYTAYTQALGVHPTDTNRIIIGAVNARRSTDGGKTYALVNTGHSDNHVFVNVGTSDNFLMGSDGGVWRIGWFGTTAQTLGAGYTTFQFYAGNYGKTGKTAIGGLQDNGTVLNQGNTLTRVNGGDGGYSHISQQDPDKGYMSYVDGATYRASALTAGGSVTTITPTAAIAEGTDFINEFEMNYADDQQLYFRTAKGLWRTLNSGITWTKLNGVANLANIQAIGVENKVNPNVYVGGAQIFCRFDSAVTFDAAVNNYVFLKNSVPTDVRADAWGTISFHPSVSSTLFVGLTTMSPSGRAWRINKANTDTPEWVNISGDLPSALSVYQVQAHPDKPDSVFFAATAFGLYCTVNGGKNWTKETRVPNVPIFEIKLRATDRSLFLFTHGRGMFYATLKDYLTATKDIREKLALKIFPNPTSNFLNIESEAPLSMLQVFDIKGREIMTETKAVSQINIQPLVTGVYFLRVFDTSGRLSTIKFFKQ